MVEQEQAQSEKERNENPRILFPWRIGHPNGNYALLVQLDTSHH